MKFFVACIAALLSLAAAPALACNPVSSSATITVPGVYCLTGNIFVTAPGGNGLVIAASNVSLDLRGFTIDGPNSGDGAGILLAAGAHNFSVYNGQVHEFMYGIRAPGNNGLRVRGVDLSYNSFRGVSVMGDHARVEYSRIDFIHGYAGYPDSFAMGIEVSGNNCLLRFNQIRNVKPIRVGEGVGISLSSGGNGCQVYDNMIRLLGAAPDYGRTLAIWIGGQPTGLSVHNNVILGTMYGVTGPAAASFAQNYSDTPCGPWGAVQAAPDCTDTLDYVEAKTVAEPLQGEWWFRLGVIHGRQLDDEAEGLIHLDHSCSLGIDEACRVAAAWRAN